MVETEDLIRRGYFPRELPPPFTTSSLADVDPSELKFPKGTDLVSECTRHNLARVGGFRRLLKVPNPMNFMKLAAVIEELWPSIDEHLLKSALSISRPKRRGNDRALVPEYRFTEKPWFRARYRSGSRFVLESDVSQFYSSLYTHSLPWALHGKAVAKANLDKTAADKLDRAIRRGSANQTIGIPIGPDTSLVAAEIVLTAVDQELQEALAPSGPIKGFDIWMTTSCSSVLGRKRRWRSHILKPRWPTTS